MSHLSSGHFYACTCPSSLVEEKMSIGHQKPDHGGKFLSIPHRLVTSLAWRELSNRAAKVLLIFQSRHNGFNNGKIALAIHDIGLALGNQNHKANSRAVAELIEKGFLECVFEVDRRHSKAREYRLTYIPAGDKKGGRPPSNEYLDWQPSKLRRRKFGGARITSESGNYLVSSTTQRKVSVATTGTQEKEMPRISVDGCVAGTAPHIGNQYGLSDSEDGNLLSRPRPMPRGSAGVEQNDLRTWLSAVLLRLGHGGQKRLSEDSGVPAPVICKFKKGRGLPSHYLLRLQNACARILPFKEVDAISRAEQ